MKRGVLKLTIFAALLAFMDFPAFGWDDTGHKITGYIAWQRMTPEVREKVITILRAAPEDANISTFFLPYGSRSDEAKRREFFMLMATWADIVRDNKFEVRYKKYHKGNWHYADTFWEFTDGKAKVVNLDIESGIVLKKLPELEQTIRDASATNADKAVAIAWLEHLIGDLHQPLHSGSRVTKYDPKGDQGGNAFLLTPRGTPRDKQENLHWFWDSITVRNNPNTKDACDADYVDPIAESILKKFPYEKLKDRLKAGKFDEWHQESYEIVSTKVYSGVTFFEPPSDKYKKTAFEIAEERFALAGYRMAELFNAVFSTPVSPVASCQIIRKIDYPVFKKQTPENQAKAKPTAVLLDVCPTGPAARPTIMVAVNGKTEARAFDVIKTFASEDEARAYATSNSIRDVNFTDQ